MMSQHHLICSLCLRFPRCSQIHFVDGLSKTVQCRAPHGMWSLLIQNSLVFRGPELCTDLMSGFYSCPGTACSVKAQKRQWGWDTEDIFFFFGSGGISLSLKYVQLKNYALGPPPCHCLLDVQCDPQACRLLPVSPQCLSKSPSSRLSLWLRFSDLRLQKSSSDSFSVSHYFLLWSV